MALPLSAFNAQDGISVRALLSHTAGVPEYGLPGYGSADPTPTLVQVLQGTPPATNPPVRIEYRPGSRYKYSSLGYAVLQQMLMDVTGQPFDVLAQENVLQPLAMHNSFFAQLPLSTFANRIAAGHDLDRKTFDGNWRRYPELASGGLWSTASDLAHFAIAIQRAASGQDSRFLTQQQADEMLTAVHDSYGLGFELDHMGSEPVFHHSGSNAGYKALLFAYTRTGKGAVILTNADNGWMLIEEIMRSIAAEYAWEDYHPMERVSVGANTALFDRFTGDFNVSNTTLHISHDGDHLYIAGPPIGPQPAELIPAGDYDYFIREKDATLHFDSNGSASIEILTFVDGRPRKGKRIVQAPTRNAVPRLDTRDHPIRRDEIPAP